MERINGVIIGRLVSSGDAEAQEGPPSLAVDFDRNPAAKPLSFVTVVPLGEAEIGRDVVLTFEEGDPRRPVVLGLVQKPLRETSKREASGPFSVEADGERVRISAERELVLRCGKASITLTRAGKVLVRGTYLLSRSSGVNRIKGGSVQIN